MSNRFSQFSDQERIVIQEALTAFTDQVIEDDDFFMDGYDEDELEELKSARDSLIQESIQ